MVLDLPPDFVRNIRQSFAPNGERWLQDLPTLLAEAARRWCLTLGKPFQLSYNYVCAARRADHSPVVLKIGVPNRELTSEIHTLRIYDGHGACHLLDADAEKGMLLLEYLQPGKILASLIDDDHATVIAAEVMKKNPESGLYAGRFSQSPRLVR